MAGLQRITTQYDEREDRIRLAGETMNDQMVVLWFTQRMLHRLLPVSLEDGLKETIAYFRKLVNDEPLSQ